MDKKHGCKKFLAAFLLVMFSGICIYAEESESVDNNESKKIVLTASMAVEEAVKTHVSIKQEAIQLNRAEKNYKHSWNNFLPSITASAEATDAENTSTSTGEYLDANASLTASLSLNTGLAKKIAMLKEKYVSGQADYEDTVRDVEADVRKAFYSLLYTKQEVESSKENLASYENQYNQTKIKRDRGLVPELDLLSAQVNVANAKLSLRTTEKSYYNALIEFLNDIGLDITPDTEIELSGSLDDCDSVLNIENKIKDKETVEKLIENSPSVRTLKDSLKIAELNKQYTFESNYMPSLTLSASVTPKDYLYYKKTSSSADYNSWSASVGVSIPLDSWIPCSSASDSVAETKDTIADYELQIADAKKSVRTQFFEKLHDIDISKETLEERKLNMELAKKTYEMTEDAYSKGTKDLLTLQTALDSYHSAELEWRNEQYNLLTYVLDLENLLGLEIGSFLKN
ncbi:MAG: TolC family protein [Treponema sp.]|nr:TolC family protein [Treponema sp.]